MSIGSLMPRMAFTTSGGSPSLQLTAKTGQNTVGVLTNYVSGYTSISVSPPAYNFGGTMTGNSFLIPAHGNVARSIQYLYHIASERDGDPQSSSFRLGIQSANSTAPAETGWSSITIKSSTGSVVRTLAHRVSSVSGNVRVWNFPDMDYPQAFQVNQVYDIIFNFT